jgi:hypothetical protein
MSVDGPVKGDKGIRGELPPFDELFKLHHRKVYALCSRMTGNVAEAEDLRRAQIKTTISLPTECFAARLLPEMDCRYPRQG